jgi:DNA modification methylase
VQCVVTSPPYYGLRDYGVAGQIGLEATPEEWVAELVAVFREVRRVLRDDGALWLNVGDCYGSGTRATRDVSRSTKHGYWNNPNISRRVGSPAKQLLGMPWRLALALQADGWWVRSDIIWAKPNPMPESVTDRPTAAHEHVFLLTKSARYFYDADAVREEVTGNAHPRGNGVTPKSTVPGLGIKANSSFHAAVAELVDSRNLRNVWTLATEPYAEAHFATFPTALAERCIKAGTSERGCCGACGAPWVRQTERVATGRTQKMADGWDTGDSAHGTRHRNGREAGERGIPVTANVTTGWMPSCRCNTPAVPCAVLDPFAGAGTTLLVADRLQRDAVGIELSGAYVEMARRRIAGDAPLFAEAADE